PHRALQPLAWPAVADSRRRWLLSVRSFACVIQSPASVDPYRTAWAMSSVLTISTLHGMLESIQNNGRLDKSVGRGDAMDTPTGQSADTGSAYDMQPSSYNASLTEVGRGTPCGEFMRRYWQPGGICGDVGTGP